jgi:ATP-dependent DNA ligase
MPILGTAQRKRILRRIVPAQPAPVLYADHFERHGVNLFRAVCERDLEGIVAKYKHGLYTAEETTWVKIKNQRYRQAKGRHDFFQGYAARAAE